MDFLQNIPQSTLLSGGLLFLLGLLVILFFIALPYIEQKVPFLRALRLSTYLRRIPIIGPYFRQAQMARAQIDRTRKQVDRVQQDKTRLKKAWDQSFDKDGDKQANVQVDENGEPIRRSGATSRLPDGMAGEGGVLDEMTSSPSRGQAVSSIRPDQPTIPVDHTPVIGRIPVPPEFAVNLEKASKEREIDVLGRRIERYQVDGIIAEGNLSSLYQTFDMKMNRLMALKVMVTPEHFDIAERDRLLEDIRALASADHPNLVHIYDYGEAQGQLFIVTEFVNGLPIDQHMKHMADQGQKMNMWQITLTMAYAASAMADAHRLGVTHGHWKPGHILLESSPATFSDLPFHVELADTGLGVLYESVDEMPQVMWPYVSPAQCRGEKPSAASDIYSMGALLYHLAVGKRPFTPQSSEEAIKLHTESTPPLPTAVSPTLPLAIEAIILKAMAKEPAERYQSAKEMAQALWEAAQQMSRSASGSVLFREGDHILHVETIGEPRRTIILDRPTMFTGRSPENEIVLPGVKVANQQVRLERESDHWVAYHLDPHHSTYLQGAKLLSDLPEIWESGQVLLVDPYILTWEEVTETRDNPIFAFEQLEQFLVGIVVQPAAGEVNPGEFVDFQINIINQAAHVDHFEVQIEGLPATWLQISNNDLSLLPGDQGRVLLNISPPMGSDITPGEYPITIRVVPRSYPKHMATADALLMVQAKVEVVAELEPERVRNVGVVQLALRNNGNAAATCQLATVEEMNKLLFEYGTEPFTLAAGEEQLLDVGVKVEKRPLISQPRHYPFNVQLDVAQMQHPLTHPAQVEVTSRIPLWLVPILGLFLIILCFGVMLAGSTYFERWLDSRNQVAEVDLPTPTPNIPPPSSDIPVANNLPANCSNIKQTDPEAKDGEYDIFIHQNESLPLTVYCHNMTDIPTAYLTLATNSENQNFSSIVVAGETIRTDFSKIRINLASLTIDRTDYTFAALAEDAPTEQKIRDYGSAIGCDRTGAGGSVGIANIDLSGTPFALDDSVQFVIRGNDASGEMNISNDRKMADLSVTGNCGWVWSADEISLSYSP